MKTVEEWSICGEFHDILNDIKDEKVLSENIWINKATNEFDVDVAVSLDERGEICFDADSKIDKGLVFIRAMPQLYQLRDVDETVVASFQDAKRSFSAAYRGNFTSIDVADTNSCQHRIAIGDSEGGISISTCGKNSSTLHETIKLNAHASHITKTQFFPSGQVVLSSSIDMRLKIWDAATGANPRTFIGHRRSVNDFVMIDRGRNFVSGSGDGTLKLWDCSSGDCLLTFDNEKSTPDAVNCLSLSDYTGSVSNTFDHGNEFGTEGKAVFSGRDSGIISYHDIFNRTKILDVPAVVSSSCVSITPGAEHYLYAGYDNGNVISWDTRNLSSPIDILSVNTQEGISRIRFSLNKLALYL